MKNLEIHGIQIFGFDNFMGFKSQSALTKAKTKRIYGVQKSLNSS